ncbi:MAG: hypothetical protein IKW39_05715 [Alphaproteobacteria bacterium]|nr:hypothetical protein [Alphaproteobacteria bacterium]
MLTKLLYALPEISIILGILHLSILCILSYESPKVYAKTARLWLLVSLFSIIIFYDKSYNFQYFENTSYTMLMKSVIIFFSYIILIISPFWFSAENKTGYKFLVYIFLSIVTSSLLISSVNIISLLVSYIFLTYTNYRLINISSKEISNRHIKVSTVIIFLMSLSFFYFYMQDDKIVGLNDLKYYILSKPNDFIVYIFSVFLLIPFLYLLGAAPFHLEKEDIQGKSILPVSHYFAIIIPIVSISLLIKLKETVFTGYENNISFAFLIMGVFSIIFGALGANSRINLHRIYAHGSMYHQGIVLILLSFFTPKADFSGFMYLLFYLVTLNGLYVVFYNLKSHGEFLSSQISLSGLAQSRPNTTRALLIGIFSLLGIPPFTGFLAEFGFINELLYEKSYLLLIVILVFFLILSKSYLEIIKISYFEQKIKSYDAENKTILLTTLFCMFLIIIISFNPWEIIEKIKDMFYVIYL